MLGLWLLPAAPARAQSDPLLLGGVRVGYSDTEYKGILRQLEGVVRYDLLPFRQGRTWNLRLGVEGSVGVLGNDVDEGALVGGGLHLTLGLWHDVLAFDTGLSAAMLTDHTFGRVTLGNPAQFITHWRLRVHPLPFVGIAYRFQHMSNGGLGLENPGLNLHMVELTLGG